MSVSKSGGRLGEPHRENKTLWSVQVQALRAVSMAMGRLVTGRHTPDSGWVWSSAGQLARRALVSGQVRRVGLGWGAHPNESRSRQMSAKGSQTCPLAGGEKPIVANFDEVV